MATGVPVDPISAISQGVGSGIGAIADIYGAQQASNAQQKANETNLQIARENREWQTQMAGSAYQRAKNDMLAAGLNPAVLMQGAGGPASTPAGNVATMESVAPQIATSAMEVGRMAKEFAETVARTKEHNARVELLGEEKKMVQANTTNAKLEAELRDKELVPIRNRTPFEKRHGGILGPIDSILHRLSPIVGIGAGFMGGRMMGVSSAKRKARMMDRGTPFPVGGKGVGMYPQGD